MPRSTVGDMESAPTLSAAAAAAAAAKSLQLCPTLCNPIDSSPPDFPVFQVFYFIYLMIPSSVSFISVLALFISVYLSFSSSRSLLNFSCIFSIHASILFLRSWISFTVITLNSFSDRLLISSSFSCSSRF